MTSLSIPLPTNSIVDVIRALYGTIKPINEFIDEQIATMAASPKESIQICGRILGGVKAGFGLGYVTSTVTIAIGHFLMGNTLQAAVVLGSSAVFSNPIAMTCAAIGAIYCGWHALEKHEKETIIEKIMVSFEMGAELVKAIINYVLTEAKALMNPEVLLEIKALIKESAKKFGKSLGEVTKSLKDKASDTAEYVSDKVSNTAGYVADKAGDVADFVKEKAIHPVQEKLSKK